MVKCSDRQRLVSQPVFKEFLESHAPKLYKIILDSILSERHGEKRANLQEKMATALIRQLLCMCTGGGIWSRSIRLRLAPRF